MKLPEYLKGFVGLFFPEVCAGCERPLVKGEFLICVNCQYHLPDTQYHKIANNEAFQLLGGQAPFVSVSSYLHFRDDSAVQQMVHRIKYLGMPGLAYHFGRQYGKILVEADHIAVHADFLVPVPVQQKKLRKRGYNQSEVFARGLADTTGIPVMTGILSRRNGNSSQVGKGRSERFGSLAEAITLEDNEILRGSHVLLVDDVLTSGATAVACAQALLGASVTGISLLTLARKR